MQVDRVGRERLLDPVWHGRFVGRHVAERILEIGPGIVCIEHQVDIGTDRFAGGLNAIRFLAHGEPADLDFDGIEAHLDVTFELGLQAFVPLSLEIVASRCVGRDGIFVVAAEHAPERQSGGA